MNKTVYAYDDKNYFEKSLTLDSSDAGWTVVLFP